MAISLAFWFGTILIRLGASASECFCRKAIVSCPTPVTSSRPKLTSTTTSRSAKRIEGALTDTCPVKTSMKIWTSEHVFGHSWESVCRGQWQKYPNPHNPAVLGTDVVERQVDATTGVLHSHRIITTDWGLAPWVQSLIGANRPCYAHEYSTVDPVQRVFESRSVNLTFCNFVSMTEQMSYRPDPTDPENKTLMKQETVVTVQGVPLTSYMESLIVNTVSANAAKGRRAIDWVVDKLSTETKSLYSSLEDLKLTS